MHVSINIQLTGCHKFFYLGFARERFKTCFLISNISMAYITLCHGQNAAHEIWVEQACSRII